MMSRDAEPDVSRLINVVNLAQAWSCTPSEVLGEDCFYVLMGPTVMNFLHQKAIQDAKNASGR